MTTPPESDQTSAGERLRQALGWDKLPEMTAEQREKFEEDQARLRDEVRQFYGDQAAA